MSDEPKDLPDSESTEPELERTEKSTTKNRAPSPVILAFCMVIVGLLVVLIIQGIQPGGALASKDSPSMDALKADIETRRTLLNRERIAMGLEPMAGASGTEAAEEVAARLKTDADTLASLAGSFQVLLEDKDRELDLARKEAIDSLKETQRMRELLEAIRIERDKALLEATRNSTLQGQLDAANNRIALLDAELVRLREEPGRLQQELLACQSERSQLLNRIADLEAQLAQLSQADLFATTENAILKEAIALFRELRKLEGKADSEIMSAYSSFGAKYGASVLKKCDFATGSSEIAPELNAGLMATMSEVPDGAIIFAVGYASRTGNADNNQTLSSDRATAVAQLLDSAKQPNQRVQAVYLGQTDRFSSRVPERNQIVEIWQIVPPNMR
ncbi:OmpA family protein [Haloferula chungangensis]|uniref:OmpA family protein n=1 Tax=Haloferula chungangensis TaxID=1048331 RepID=A0ABW2L6N9_9BACT